MHRNIRETHRQQFLLENSRLVLKGIINNVSVTHVLLYGGRLTYVYILLVAASMQNQPFALALGTKVNTSVPLRIAHAHIHVQSARVHVYLYTFSLADSRNSCWDHGRRVGSYTTQRTAQRSSPHHSRRTQSVSLQLACTDMMMLSHVIASVPSISRAQGRAEYA